MDNERVNTNIREGMVEATINTLRELAEQVLVGDEKLYISIDKSSLTVNGATFSYAFTFTDDEMKAVIAELVNMGAQENKMHFKYHLSVVFDDPTLLCSKKKGR